MSSSPCLPLTSLFLTSNDLADGQGTVIGTFPGTLMMVWFRPSVWLPFCEVVWTVLVMACAAAKNPKTLYGLRFVIGLLEATAYPGKWTCNTSSCIY